MTYQQLMKHAYDIRDKAISVAAVETATDITAGHRPFLTQAEPDQIGYARPDRVILSERQMHDIRQYFADVPEWFKPFAELPDPDAFTPAITALDAVLSTLSSSACNTDPFAVAKDKKSFSVNKFVETLTPLQEDLTDWTGEAADDFRNNFLTEFASDTANNFKLATALKSALVTEQVLWTAARKNIDDIAEAVLTTLDQLHEMTAAQWDVMWAVVGAAIALISIPLPGGLAVVATVAAGAAGVMSAGGGAPSDAKSTGFDAGNAPQLIGQMIEAIRKLTNDICTAEADIALGLRQTNAVVAANQNTFISRRPALADATASDIKSDRYMGHEEE